MILLFASCAVMRPAAVVRPPSFEEVRDALARCEAARPLAECESEVRTELARDWSLSQRQELHFILARLLHRQERHETAARLLRDIPTTVPYIRDVRLLGASAAFAAGDWNGALEFLLAVYLSLSTDEKNAAARIVFLSYLYRGDTEKAARWYSKINDEKRALVREERDAFFAKNATVAADFAAALMRFSAEEEQAAVDPAAPPIAVSPPVGTAEEDMVPREAPPVVIDESYTPDWNALCLFLSEEDRWRRVNELVEVFFDWFFKEYSKEAVTPSVLRHLGGEDIEAAFVKAKDSRCFAGIGPLFTDVAADDFARFSAVTPLPLFSVTPWFAEASGLLFNLKYTKDREVADLLAWLTGRDKKRFAIAYPDDPRGRRLRDLYWRAVEEAGGTVTDALAFGPGDKALLDDVDDILSMPEGYNGTVYRFKQENAAKYATPTMMKRALGRIEKMTPMQADFDTLLMLGAPDQVALLPPALVYKNVEFEYYTGWERNRVRENQHKLRTEFNLPWEINTVLLAAPSEVRDDAVFEKNVGKLIDGMALAASWQNTGESNAAWKPFAEAFSAKFQREPYPIEQTLAEIGTIILAARERGGKTTLAAFVAALRGGEFRSLTADRPVSFNERNQLSGIGEIFIGVKGRGFRSAGELQKEEEKEKGRGKEEKEKEPQKEPSPQ